jgi:hypothetical protein
MTIRNYLKKRKGVKNYPKKIRKNNTTIASQRAGNEHAIGFIKRFKIVCERYRHRRQRFGLRFSLIAGICNFELALRCFAGGLMRYRISFIQNLIQVHQDH